MDNSTNKSAYQLDIQKVLHHVEANQSMALQQDRVEDYQIHRMNWDKLKDLQNLTFGTAKDQALSALDRHQLASLHALTRIMPNGQHINLINPTDEQLDLPAIICNLGNLTRFGGSAQQFDHKPFVVAHHLLLGLWILENVEYVPTKLAESVKRYWLAHDAQEGSLGFDLITPVKTLVNKLAGWDILKYIEDNHSKAIHEKLGLIWPVPDEINAYVKKIDNICVCTEAKYLLHDPCDWAEWNNPLPERLFADFMHSINEFSNPIVDLHCAFESNFGPLNTSPNIFKGFEYDGQNFREEFEQGVKNSEAANV